MQKDTKLKFLIGFFVMLLITMNTLGTKIIEVLGVNVSVGIFLTPLTFLTTDIIEEVYGKNEVKKIINIGLFCLAFVFITTVIFISLPASERFTASQEYNLVFGSSLRMIFASLISFFLSARLDAYIFALIKEKTNGKKLWLRNNLSTMLAQGLDTFCFMMIAFYGISEQFTFTFVISLALPYYIFKIIFALIDTPLVYLGVNWLKK